MYFALDPENLNSIGGTACCSITLISLLWSLCKFELWYLNKERVNKIEKNCNKFLQQKMSLILKKYFLALAENELNHCINLTHRCLCSDYAKGMFLFGILLWYNMWHHYFAVATGTTILCGLFRRYGPVCSLSFLDVYGLLGNNNFQL